MRQLFLIIVVLCIGSCDALLAAERIVAVTENWRPYNYEENGAVKGTSTEIVRAVLDRSGVEYTIKVFPWGRSYNMALSQENILIYTIMRAPEREELFKWVGPVANSDQIFLYKLRTRKDIILESLDHAKLFRIGVNRDTPAHAYLLALDFDDSLIDVVAFDQMANINKLLYGRIDLIPASETQFKYMIKEAGLSENTFEKALPLFELAPYMAFSRETPDALVEKVTESYNALVTEGKIRKFN